MTLYEGFDRNREYILYRTNDLPCCVECGGQLAKFVISEVACLECGLVHITPDKFSINTPSYVSGGIPIGRMGYKEEMFNKRLRSLVIKNLINEDEYNQLKIRNSNEPFRHIKDKERRDLRRLFDYQKWLNQQDVSDEAKRIALGYMFQLNKYNYHSKGKGGLQRIYEHLLDYAIHPKRSLKKRSQINKLLKKCRVKKMSLVSPVKTELQYYMDYKLSLSHEKDLIMMIINL